MPVQPPCKISFNFQTPCPLTARKRLKGFIAELFKAESRKLSELTYVFCSDEYLLELNKSFLEHDYFTDDEGNEVGVAHSCGHDLHTAIAFAPALPPCPRPCAAAAPR